MFKAVVFDLDGTLVDSIGDLAAAVNTLLGRRGFPVHPLDRYRYYVGDGIRKLIERALPQGSADALADDALVEFVTIYEQHCLDQTAPYPGIHALLTDLVKDNIRLAVVSNKAQSLTEKIVGALFPGKFGFVAGMREGFAAKPDAGLTLLSLQALGVRPEETLFVGDSGTDMATAVNSGCLPVGALWGFRTREELEQNGAAVLAENPAEILRLIEKGSA